MNPSAFSPRRAFQEALARTFPEAPTEEAALFRWTRSQSLPRCKLELAPALAWLPTDEEVPVLIRACRYRGAAHVHDPNFEAPSPFATQPLDAVAQKAEIFSTRVYQPYVEDEEVYEWGALSLLWKDLPLEWCIGAWHTFELEMLAIDCQQKRLLWCGYLSLEELRL